MNANFDEKIGLAKCSEIQAIGNYLKNISVILLIMFAELKRCITFVSTKTNKTKKDMTLTVTIPTGKAGKVNFFKIQFDIQNFDKVTSAVSLVQSEKELRNSNLWIVL